MSAESAIQGVQRAAKKRARAIEARNAATDELRERCQEAQAQGVPISQIAREAGLSRQGVYDLLSGSASR